MSDTEKPGQQQDVGRKSKGAARSGSFSDWLEDDVLQAISDRGYQAGLEQVQQLQVQRLRLQTKSLQSGRRLQIALFVVTALGILSLATAWLFYGGTFNGPRTDDAAAWGQAGDFIGGVTNPVLTFLSLIALVLTVKLQNDQLAIASDDLAMARQAAEDSRQREADQVENARALADTQRRTAEAQENAANALKGLIEVATLSVHERSRADEEMRKLQRSANDARVHSARMTERAAAAHERAARLSAYSAQLAAIQGQLDEYPRQSSSNTEKRARGSLEEQRNTVIKLIEDEFPPATIKKSAGEADE